MLGHISINISIRCHLYLYSAKHEFMAMSPLSLIILGTIPAFPLAWLSSSTPTGRKPLFAVYFLNCSAPIYTHSSIRIVNSDTRRRFFILYQLECSVGCTCVIYFAFSFTDSIYSPHFQSYSGQYPFPHLLPWSHFIHL